MSFWSPEYDNMDPDDFLYDAVQQFRKENPPPEDRISDPESHNPEQNPGAAESLDYYLYYGVPDLTQKQRQERLENAYYSKMLDIGRQTAAQRAQDIIDREKSGQSLPQDILNEIHDETLSRQMEEEARKAADENYQHAMRLGTLEAYHNNAEIQQDHGQPLPALYGTLDKWPLSPGVNKVLSEKKGYDGEYYSWFFGQNDNSRELDDKFYHTVKDGLEAGKPEKEIIDEATEVCTADNLNRARIKNIVRTETTRAFNEGMILEDDRIREELEEDGMDGGIVAYLFQAVMDGREWEGCKARNGLLISAKDPLLKDNTPPLHYFCRSRLTPIDEFTFDIEMDGENRVKADREKLLAAPVFQWHYTPDKGIFKEADLPE